MCESNEELLSALLTLYDTLYQCPGMLYCMLDIGLTTFDTMCWY